MQEFLQQVFSVSALSLFIWECLKYPMIFYRYRLYLLYVWRSNWRKTDRWKRGFLKVLGLCPYCYSTHLVWMYLAVKGYGLEYVLAGIGINYLFIKLGLMLFK